MPVPYSEEVWTVSNRCLLFISLRAGLFRKGLPSCAAAARATTLPPQSV